MGVSEQHIVQYNLQSMRAYRVAWRVENHTSVRPAVVLLHERRMGGRPIHLSHHVSPRHCHYKQMP